jgi:hypothetical protein
MLEWLEFSNTYRAPAQHLVSILLAGAIWRWGGAPERWLIAIFLATMVLPMYVLWGLDPPPEWQGVAARVYTMLDLLAAVLFVAVALNANRNYPLWIAGFQLVAVGAHVVRVMVESAAPLAYAILIIGPSYCQLLVLAVGFVRHVLRERRFGPYRAWRQSAPFARVLPSRS